VERSDFDHTQGDDGDETTEVVHAEVLPAFIRAEAVISGAAANASPAGTDILAFDSMQATRTFVGYLYGGIRAYPYRFPI
jgi:hypothetical protein